jgi:hypothetical protein
MKYFFVLHWVALLINYFVLEYRHIHIIVQYDKNLVELIEQ